MMMKMTDGLIAASVLLANGMVTGQRGWAPAMPESFPPSPNTGGVVFDHVETFPRPGDPGYDSNRLCARVSGLAGFVDDGGTLDPRDDREYVVAGRSDGVFLIDVTPSGAPVAESLPASNTVSFVEDLAITNGQTAVLGLLNGGVWNGQPYGPYCAGALAGWVWNTNDTTNREVVVYRVGPDEWAVYCVNRIRRGLCALRVSRASGGAQPGRLELGVPPGGIAWQTPPLAGGGELGICHNIAVDQQGGMLFVSDNSSKQLHGFGIVAGDPYALESAVLSRDSASSGYHDIFVKNGFMYASDFGALPSSSPTVEMFRLPVEAGAVPVVTVASSFVANSHSVYADDAAPFKPSLWMLAEHPAVPRSSRRTLEQFEATSDNVYTSVATYPWFGKAAYVYPDGEEPGVVHNLRGMGRAGYLASYTDGVSLVDLSTDEVEVLGSFDFLAKGFPSPYRSEGRVPPLYHFLDEYNGAWDVSPSRRSGLLRVSGGEAGLVVLRVDHGILNRYWDPTPFANGTYPQLAVGSGPVRATRPLLFRDANRAALPATVGGARARYRWWLIAAQSDQAPSEPTRPFSVGAVQVDIDFNLGADLNYAVLPSPWGSDRFSIPPGVLQATSRYFVQMIVERQLLDGGGWGVSTYAASRGAWFGVAP